MITVSQQNSNSIEGDFDNDENNRQTLQASLNKTTKFTRKPGTGNIIADPGPPKSMSNSGLNRFDGHNYTVSINFNRPQQSKGIRPKRGNLIRYFSNNTSIAPQPEESKAWVKSNNFFSNNTGFESPSGKNGDNIYNYDIDMHGNYISRDGLIDVESSTRKRPSKTAAGKKRSLVSPHSLMLS